MWILFGLDSNKITVKTHDWGDVDWNPKKLMSLKQKMDSRLPEAEGWGLKWVKRVKRYKLQL